MTTQDASARLAEAYRAYRDGDLDRASTLTDALCAAHPQWAAPVHLAGMVARKAGDLSRAEDLMRRSLEMPGASARERAEYANNLGNLLHSAGFTLAAEAAYQLAIEGHNLPEARLGLARTLLETLRADEALIALDGLSAADAGRAAAVLLRSETLAATGEPQRALEALTAAADTVRQRPVFWLSLATRLTDVGRHAEAETAARPLLRGELEPAARVVMARVHEARREWDEARVVLRGGLARHPTDIGLLSRDAALAWMTGDARGFADRLRAAVRAAPADHALRLALVNSLTNAGREEEAEAELRAGLAIDADDGHLGALLALRCATTERLTEARRLIGRALERQGELELVRENAAITALIGLRTEEAQEHTRWLIERRPTGQSAWSLRVLALRLAGDPAWTALADPSRVCSVVSPPPPPGFASVEEFNTELAQRLRQRHTLSAHPLANSVRNGTQIEIHLGAETDPVIRAFFDFVHPAIEAFVAAMPDQPGHPLFGRRSTGYRLSGCWTVRLTGEGGKHVDHVHPQGWISSAYYAAVPPQVASDERRGGWLSFGQPPYPIPGMGPLGWVAPRIGKLALFPSYQWHGVKPFEGEGERISIAFDVIPVRRPVGAA